MNRTTPDYFHQLVFVENVSVLSLALSAVKGLRVRSSVTISATFIPVCRKPPRTILKLQLTVSVDRMFDGCLMQS